MIEFSRDSHDYKSMEQRPLIQSTRLSESTKLILRPRELDVIACIGLVFFLFCAVMSYRQGKGVVWPVFLGFALPYILLLLINGQILMDENGVSFTNYFGQNQIMWGEVRSVAVDYHKKTLVFFSANKSHVLNVPGPSMWLYEKHGLEMEKFLDKQLDKRQIVIKEDNRAVLVLSRNTKVK